MKQIEIKDSKKYPNMKTCRAQFSYKDAEKGFTIGEAHKSQSKVNFKKYEDNYKNINWKNNH